MDSVVENTISGFVALDLDKLRKGDEAEWHQFAIRQANAKYLLEEAPKGRSTESEAVAQEVADFLQNEQSALLNSALDEAEQRRRDQYTGDDELLGLDEEELDRFILTEQEVQIKERVWVEMNKDYLEALASK